MITTFKISLLSICSVLILSFNTINERRIEIVNSNIELDINQIDLKEGIYLINKSKYSSLFVEVKPKKVNGKRTNGEDFEKQRVKGIKYVLNFEEKLNNQEKVLTREKVFVTIWENGEIDTWNTKPNVQIGKYQFEIIKGK